MKPKFYFCDLWRMNYYYFIGWTWDDFKKYIARNYEVNIAQTVVPHGYTIEIGHKDRTMMCIFLQKKNDYASLAHESLHAANWTLLRAGWQPDLGNDEPQAYLMTNIMRQALEK